MGRQIIVQPDGLFAIYSTVSDQFEVYDADKQEIIDYFVEEAAESMAQKISTTIEQLEDHGPRRVYAQFALTFDSAYDNHLAHGGGVLPFSGLGDFEYEQCPHCKNAKRIGVGCMSQSCLDREEENEN